ncbi:MAG: putative sulfate transporter [Syntrophorhabdus sp. PtaB.Bin047]|nr:MAG: putative sulfate transporter [Syntrophorhabdus sp. PtaB.Bin047]
MAENVSGATAAGTAPRLAGRYLTVLTAGLISGVLTIAMGCAFSALIFSGPLSGYIATGVKLILFGAFLLGAITAFTSSYAGTVARPHEIPAAVIALMAAAIAAGVPGRVCVEGAFVTVAAAIAVTGCATGIFFLLLGYFKAGNLIRFVPYPVIGGFLAGTGLLLVKGAFGVMTGKALTVANMAYLADPAVFVKWLPGLVFAGVLFLALRWRNHYLIMPVWLALSFVFFYIALPVTGMSLGDARSQGWLIASLEGGGPGAALSLSSLAGIDWGLVASQTGRILTVLILSSLSLLLNASGLELVVREEIDLNRELRATGLSNLVAGLSGSTVGFHSLSLSALGHSMGAKSRLVGLFSAVLCGAVLFFGSSLLSYFPRPIMGGVLLFLGLAFLHEWLYESWLKLPMLDCVLIVVILVVIGMFGFLQGVGVGMLVAIVIFVVKYSHVSVIKHRLSGADFHSNVDRAPDEEQVLSRQGEGMHILKLQGYIFFGTANDLYEEIRRRSNAETLGTLRFAVLDFRLVNGVDSSAVNSFVKMKEQARTRGYRLVFAQVPPDALTSFRRGGLGLDQSDSFRVFGDLDRAVEWCEDEILAAEGMLSDGEVRSLGEELREFFPPAMRDPGRFIDYLERREVPAGFYLIRQGDPPHSLYYLESGRATVDFENESGQRVRLRTLRPGTVIGELGLYLRGPSTASVVTETTSVFCRFTSEAMERMERQDPEMAAAFHRFIVRRLGERLIHTNRSLKALLD